MVIKIKYNLIPIKYTDIGINFHTIILRHYKKCRVFIKNNVVIVVIIVVVFFKVTYFFIMGKSPV